MMKKIFIALILTVFCIFLCSCDKKSYEVKEISYDQLNAAVFEGNNNMIFAVYDERSENKDEFLNDLKKVSTQNLVNIYYINLYHPDSGSAVAILNYFNLDFVGNSYYILNNNELELSKNYTTYQELKNDLKGKTFKKVKFYEVTKEKINEYLEKAEETYNEGKLSESLEYVNFIWQTKEAKEFYKNRPNYELVKTWECYKRIDEEKFLYKKLVLTAGENSFYDLEEKAKLEEITETFGIDEYISTYYYVKNNYIYTNDTEEGKYKKTYEIKELTSNKLSLVNLKNKEVYNFTRKEYIQ